MTSRKQNKNFETMLKFVSHIIQYIRSAKEIEKKCQDIRLTLDDTTSYALHYADDLAVLAQDKEDLDLIGRKLIEEYKK